jgi:protocatechuate 3,4-dioxygenase, beta subunit
VKNEVTPGPAAATDTRGVRRPASGVHPPSDAPGYRSTALRHPKRPLILLPHGRSELSGPVFGRESIGPLDHDLTRQFAGEPIGQRLVVEGRVLDEDGRPLRDTLIEMWQANAAGRYRHPSDTHDAPLDPHFAGAGRTKTDREGRYRFVTIRPGAYPWRNHDNAWRPAHIHFSLFGECLATRLVTQMYFPDDPLLALDPIYNSIPDAVARTRLIAQFDLAITVPERALGYRFDLVLRGRTVTPWES